MRRIVTLFLFAGLVPLVVMSAVIGVLALRGERVDFEREARDQARLGAAMLSTRLSGDMRSVDMLAASAAFDRRYEDGFDRERFALIARRVLSSQPGWRAISVSNAAGDRLLDLPGPIGGRKGGTVIEAKSHALAVQTGAVTVGSIMPGPRGGLAFAIRAPVVRQGRIDHVISAIVDPTALAALVSPRMRDSRFELQVIDADGVLVVDTARPNAAGSMAGAAALQARRNSGDLYPHLPGGVAGLALTGPAEGWTVFVWAPSSVYDEPQRGIVLLLLIGVAGGAVMATAAVLVARRELVAQRLQAQALLETQRLEALGRMTGGVAHDFNNLLTPIIGSLDLLRPKISDDPKMLRLIDGAMSSAERARILVSRLLAFARRQPLDARDVELCELVNGVQELLVQTIGASVTLELDLASCPVHVHVDPAQLELAIINLAANARDAMPMGGVLKVRVEEVVAGAQARLDAGRYGKISVIDGGEGMDEPTLKRAVEPFFTTKPVGRGTGLGLSMVHGLAAQSGGGLRLTSLVGQGTVAEIWLPVAQDVPHAAGGARPVALDGAVLVVDDDDLVRQAAAQILVENGYVVETAGSMAQAVGRLKSDDPFAVLVTDIVMPGGSGVDLIAAARRLRPSLPVLVISGYAPRLDELPADVRRLAKPFRSAELVAGVQGLLAGAVEAVET